MQYGYFPVHVHAQQGIEWLLYTSQSKGQLIGNPRPISSYRFYKDICPSPNLLQLPVLHLYECTKSCEKQGFLLSVQIIKQNHTSISIFPTLFP